VSLVKVSARSEEALALLPNAEPATVFSGSNGAALIKDETRCIRCGLCARRCPASVITMQAFYRADEARVMALADQVL